MWELETGKSRNPSMDLLEKLASHFSVTVAFLVGEDPTASGEDPELIAMYRELKNLTDRDRQTVKGMMELLKSQSKRKDGDGD